MSFLPARHNWTIYQGVTFFTRILFEVDGVLQNLSAYECSLVIKDEPQGNILLTLDTQENGGIVLGVEEGTIDILIEDELTSEFTWSSGTYELLLEDVGGRVDILLRGGFKVIPF